MDWSAKLASQPTVDTVQSLLKDLSGRNLNEPDSHLLEIFSALVNTTIYDFPDVNFAPVFQSITGIGCIISQLKALSASQPGSAKITVLISLLEQTLGSSQTLLFQLWTAKPTEAQSIFVGSRLLSAASALRGDSWVGDAKKYSLWVADQLSAFDEIPPGLVDKTMKLGYAEDCFKKLMHTDKFVKCWLAMRPAQQQYCLTQGVLPALEKVSVESAAAILEHLQPKVDLVSLAEQNSMVIQVAVVCISTDLAGDALKLLETWGNPTAIRTLSMAYQTAQTQMLLSFACHMTAADARRVTSSMQFISAISNRLESLSERARFMATMVADLFSDKAGEKLRFGMDDGEWNFQTYSPGPLDVALSELDAPQRVDYTLTAVPLAAAVGSDDEDEDADAAGDSDDDEDVKPAAPPVYVATLLEYLSSDSYEQHQSALQNGALLIYRKADFGSEVAQFASELLVLLAGLGDKFNIKNFSDMRQQLMTAIVVVYTPAAEIAAKLALTGDLSLFQRMALMSTLVLAAKELANYTPSAQPVSKRLPDAQHKAFASDMDMLVSTVQDKLIIDTRSKVSDELSGPQVLRVSKRLELQKSPQQPGVNRFAKVAGRYFFFPLAVQRPRRAGAYTSMLHAHLIKTLGLLIYYAYPSNDMPDMVSELLDMLLVQTETEPVIIEAVYTALLVLCDVAGGILVSQYPQKLSGLYDWARQSWQTVPDERIQRLGAGVVLRLGDLVEQISKLLQA